MNRGNIYLKSNDLYHKDNVSLKNFNPQKLNLLCSCTEYGYGYIWDINEIKTISEFNTEKYPKGIMWSPNGNFIGICSKNGKLDIFDKKEKILKIL